MEFYKISGLTAGYEGFLPVRGLNARLPKRGVAAVSGRSGAGKSTLIRVLAGLLSPVSGDIDQGFMALKKAVVFQEDRLLPWLTAEENVAIAREGGTGEARRLLVAAGLSGFLSAYPDELSGGMKRRVALARAMHYGGDALILDEPFKGLDAPLRERVCKAVSGVFPLTVIATHDMDEARLLCPDGWPMEIIDLNRD